MQTQISKLTGQDAAIFESLIRIFHEVFDHDAPIPGRSHLEHLLPIIVATSDSGKLSWRQKLMTMPR
jgi:hypothetical protein